MLILALDTAASSMSAALWEKNKLLGELTLQIGLTHSETLMPSVDALLKQCRRDRGQLQAVACTLGPGSYTGLRIGVSTALGLAYALHIPALGFSTLEVMARPHLFHAGYVVCPVIDARNKRVFGSVWHKNQEIVDAGNYQIVDFLKKANAAMHDIGVQQAVFVGSGRVYAQSSEDRLQADFAHDSTYLPDYDALPSAAVIAKLAAERLAAEPEIIPEDTWHQLMPQYLSLTQAERKKQAHEQSEKP